jgi:hypothetical protein
MRQREWITRSALLMLSQLAIVPKEWSLAFCDGPAAWPPTLPFDAQTPETILQKFRVPIADY